MIVKFDYHRLNYENIKELWIPMLQRTKDYLLDNMHIVQAIDDEDFEGDFQFLEWNGNNSCHLGFRKNKNSDKKVYATQ